MSKPPLSPQSEPNEAPKRRRRKPRPPSADMASDGQDTPPRSRSRSLVDADVSGNEGNTTPSSTRKRSRSASGSRASQRSSTGAATPAAQTKAKPKKKKKRAVTESHETLVEAGDREVSMQPDASQAKKKKRRRKKAQVVGSEPEYEPEIGLAGELNDLEEDVVLAETTGNTLEETHWVTPVMRSEPTNKLYIEQRNGFKTSDKAKVARMRAEQMQVTYDVPMSAPTQTTMQFALSTQRVFKTISVMLSGLLSGFALWQIVGSWLLSNHGWGVFLDYYYEVALPVQSMYYYLFAFCTVAVFDRYDLGNPTRRSMTRAVTMQSGAIACLFYIIGLVFSLSIAYIDDKISLYKKRPFEELWDDEGARDSELDMWRILNLMRGIFAILGWMVIALRPGTDRLTKNLESAEENIIELSEAVRSSGV